MCAQEKTHNSKKKKKKKDRMLLFHNRQLQESLLHVMVLQLFDIKMQAAYLTGKDPG